MVGMEAQRDDQGRLFEVPQAKPTARPQQYAEPPWPTDDSEQLSLFGDRSAR